LQYGFSCAIGGLTLRAPRLGASNGRRWTLIEDSLLLPGARPAPGVRLTRAIVAPGTALPTGLVVGEDRDEDSRWFRCSEDGSVLVTSAMLARRGAERPSWVSVSSSRLAVRAAPYAAQV
jgi:glucose-1-phosphate adenylyltransferase